MPPNLYGSSPSTPVYNPFASQLPVNPMNSMLSMNPQMQMNPQMNSGFPMGGYGSNPGMPMGAYASAGGNQNFPQNSFTSHQPQPQAQPPVTATQNSPALPLPPPLVMPGAPQASIPYTLQISEIRIESLLAASKAPKGTFNDIYAEFLIAPLQESGAVNPLDHRRGATGTVAPTEILTTTPAAGSDPKKAMGTQVICNVVWYNQDIILQSCRPDWTRLKIAICKFPKGMANAVDVNSWAEKNPLKRKPLCFGELSVPWDRLPAYANCSEEIHYMDSRGNKTYGGRIQFKVTKTAEPGPTGPLSTGMMGYGSSAASPNLAPTMTYSTAGGMASINPQRNITASVYGDGMVMGGMNGGPYGSSLPPGLVTLQQPPQLPYDPTTMFTGGMIRPVTFAQSDFLPEHRKFLTKTAPPPPVRAHPLHQIQSTGDPNAQPGNQFQPGMANPTPDPIQNQSQGFGGMSPNAVYGFPPNPAAAAAALSGQGMPRL